MKMTNIAKPVDTKMMPSIITIDCTVRDGPKTRISTV